MGLDLHLVQETLGFDNVEEFCDGPPSHIKIVKGNGNYFFRAFS